jgi:hypothetical protein
MAAIFTSELESKLRQYQMKSFDSAGLLHFVVVISEGAVISNFE